MNSDNTYIDNFFDYLINALTLHIGEAFGHKLNAPVGNAVSDENYLDTCGFQNILISPVSLGGSESHSVGALALYGDSRRLVLINYPACIFQSIGALVVDIGVNAVDKLLLFQCKLLFGEHFLAVYHLGDRLKNALGKELCGLLGDILTV